MALQEEYDHKTNFFKDHMDAFEDYINSLFQEFEFELVIYDEIEYFKNYRDPEFFYPYQQRKTNIGNFVFETKFYGYEDYYYFYWTQKTVSLRQSEVCMEVAPYDIHSDFSYSLQETLEAYFPSEEEEDIEDGGSEFLDECLSDSYSKLKYFANKDSYKEYMFYNEEGLFDDIILFEVVLQLDPFKTVSSRISTSILDYLGDLGGFYQALDILVFMIGQFFSSKLFLANIAAKFYNRRLSPEEIEDNKKAKKKANNKRSKKSVHAPTPVDDTMKPQDSTLVNASTEQIVITQRSDSKTPIFDLNTLSENYTAIKFSFITMLLDPFLTIIFFPLKICLKNYCCFRRERILSKI